MSEKTTGYAAKLVLGGMLRFPEICPQVASILTTEQFPGVWRDVYKMLIDSPTTDEVAKAWVSMTDEQADILHTTIDAEPITKAEIFERAKWLGDKDRDIKLSHEISELVEEGLTLEGLLLITDGIEKTHRTETLSLSNTLDQVREEVIETINTRGQNILSCGIQAVDTSVRGIRAGALWTIAGRPSHGKSQLAAFMTHELIQGGHKVAYFSIEMGISEILLRMIGIKAGIEMDALVMGRVRIEEEEDKQICGFVKTIDEAKEWDGLLLVTDGLQTFESIRSIVTAHRPEVWFVDQLGLIPTTGDKSRAQALSELAYGFKALAVETGTTGIVLHQLNREIEKRSKEWRPQLSDLKDSGGIEEASDVVLVIVRDVYVTKKKDDRLISSLYGTKNRLTGKIGKTKLVFSSGKFFPMTPFDSDELIEG